MKILVTGCAGFIGHHTCNELLILGYEVVGIDNLNNYYDPKLKKERLRNTFNLCKKTKGKFSFNKIDISNNKKLQIIFKKYKFKKVIHLAAHAGVSYSLKNPHVYFQTNLIGFGNLIELAKIYKIDHFIYASSSSVYGASEKVPYNEKKDSCNKPLQVYAATKKSNELVAYAYSHLFNLKTTGLRFFTVYGPWGRPDMALFKFTKNILINKKIDVYNNGNNIRDFTYISDTVSGIIKTLKNNKRLKKFEILNLGNQKPIIVKKFIDIIEKIIGKKFKKNNLKKQPGDMTKTYSDNKKIEKLIGYKPETKIEIGIKSFIDWYIQYYKIKK